MRRRWLALPALMLVAAGVWWFAHRDAGSTTAIMPPHRRFDLEKLRRDTLMRVERAKQLARGRPQRQGDAAALTPDGRFLSLRHDFIDPQCWLGPRAVCDAVDDLVTSCDAGSASDCAVVGQYLADMPPRLVIAKVFFLRACQRGDQASCDRFEQLKRRTDAPCEADVFACSASAGSDLARNDEACSLGAADSCANAAHLARDPILSRAYLETGCQLGSPLLCEALAVELSPTCTPSELHRCFPPDEDEAAEARTMACEAGWTYGLDCD